MRATTLKLMVAGGAVSLAVLTPSGPASAALPHTVVSPAPHSAVPAPHSAVPGPRAVASACTSAGDPETHPDFDHSGGSDDTAFGIPNGSATDKGKSIAGAGTVEVRYGCDDDHVRLSLQLPTPHAGDHFGASVTATDAVNVDRFTDLIVGIPDYDVGSHEDAGAIAVFLGSTHGLKYSKTLTQDSPGVPGSVQTGAHFGAAVSTDAGYGNGYNVVRVGEPGKDIGKAVDAGGYVDLAYSLTGQSLPRYTAQVTLDTHGIPGHPQSGDLLGSSLFRASAVGAPGRTVNGHPGAGAVLYTSYRTDAGITGTVITQDSSCMAGAAENNDHFGAALAQNWIGVPGEDLGAAVDAGMVESWNGPGNACPSLTQNSPNVSGAPESGDHFGAALDIAFEEYDDGPSSLALFVGVPGEDTSHGVDAGMVNVQPLPGDAGSSDSITPIALYGFSAGAGFGSAFGPNGQGVFVAAPGAGTVYAYNVLNRNPVQVVLTRTLHQLTGTKGNGYYATAVSSWDGY